MDDEASGIVCAHQKCSQWATAYTTPHWNPKPWPEVSYGQHGFEGTYTRQPLWYACEEHRTHLHVTLNIDLQKLLLKPPVCEQCGNTEGVSWVGGMTQYDETNTAWDYIAYGPEGKPSANRSCPYCPDCAKDYREFWAEQWKDYYSSRL